MSGTHSKDYISNQGSETEFGSGKGSTLYGEEAPTVIGDMTAQETPFNVDQNYPVAEYLQNEYESSGQKATQKKTFNDGKMILSGSKNLHFQTLVWITRALAQLGTAAYQEGGMTGKIGSTASGLSTTTAYYWKVTTNKKAVTEYTITTGSVVTYDAIIKLMNVQMHGVAQCCLVLGDLRFIANDPSETTSTIAITAGTTGTDLLATLTDFSIEGAVTGTAGNEGQVPKSSFWETFKTGQRLYDSFGNYINKFDLDIKAGSEGIRQIMEFDTYNVSSSSYAGSFLDWIPPETSPSYVWDQFDLAINGVDVDMVTTKLGFENTFIPQDKKSGGSALHKFPYFEKAEVLLEIVQRTYDLELFTSLQTSTLLLVPIVLEFDSNAIIITNLKLVKDSLNERIMPEKGIKEYVYSLDIGDSTAIQLVAA